MFIKNIRLYIAKLNDYFYFCRNKNNELMWLEMTNSAILLTLGQRLKEYRLRRDLQQSELAAHAGVNISTIARMEKGQNVMMDSYIRVMRVLEMLDNLDEFIPEPPRSPILMRKLQGKKRYRVKRLKNEQDG